ncbi:NAD-dependent epimerase/dehydratase family protein [Ktedonosporobacter rubrisoli]|uniref:NAD-dependent epimerase/dehydratase family protein n=1 Tax=Ktedonosporobacter rubrisoli TaxID=2509675 RepID=A0A4P6JM24_KTERU|nr:NAD(P)H-binding protein [Ktedonosporobacter rubrisoli]QBD76090.1 NAD-dependent epimerase/dehydratase family protein [Ktedonosporobacter rubrisoli]
MLTILVTGATGALGREVVQQLLQQQHQVRIYTHKSPPTAAENIEVYQGDLRTGEGLIEATRGVDSIIHCATFFDEGYVTDRQGTRHLIEAALKNGSPHLIYISIVGVDRSSFSYFQMKREVEKMIESSGLPWSILRTTQFHNFVLNIITSLEDKQSSTLTLPDGVRFQSIDGSEVAQALARLASQQAAGYLPEMGGPQILTLAEMAQSYQRVYAKQNNIRLEPLQGEMYEAFRSGVNLVPERAVGQITWETFLRQRA